MTENSSSAVGRAAIDEYLDSVELALIDVGAPRTDRLQVLQDLEAQIADMLAQSPPPLTEESVRSVLEKLEPPSHFAAMYSNGKQTAAEAPMPTPPVQRYFPSMPRPLWAMIAAISCALFGLACLMAVFAAATRAHGPFELFMSLAVLSFFGTPIAIWMGFRQQRIRADVTSRDLLLKSTCGYISVALALVMLLLAAITEGFALQALGVAAFVYIEYLLIRRLWRRMAAALPAQTVSSSPRESNGNGASTPVTSPTPMPAV
jgi:hypothetical protein